MKPPQLGSVGEKLEANSRTAPPTSAPSTIKWPLRALFYECPASRADLQPEQFVPNKTRVNQSHISELPHWNVNLKLSSKLRGLALGPERVCYCWLKWIKAEITARLLPKVCSKLTQCQPSGSTWRKTALANGNLSNWRPFQWCSIFIFLSFSQRKKISLRRYDCFVFYLRKLVD